MAETLTPNYSWTKPDPGASANTWGATLNKDLDGIDAQVFKNQSAAAAGQSPIGSITMFGGASPPTGWLICNGSSLATTGTYAALFAVLGYAFGGSGANFNLPNLQSIFPFGVGPGVALGQVGGAYTTVLSVAQLPGHAHSITDVAHSHSVNQTPHNHGDPSHVHGVNDAVHSHGGVIVPGGQFSLGVAGGVGIGGPANTAGSGTGISIQGAYTGIQANNANISLNASGTGLSTTNNTGSGSAISMLPPYVGINFIIRYV